MRRQEDEKASGDGRGAWVGAEVTKLRMIKMKHMQQKEVGFKGVEEYMNKLQVECKGQRERGRGQGRICMRMVNLSMRKKIEDEKDMLRGLRHDKGIVRKRMSDQLGGTKSSKFKRKVRLMNREVRSACDELRQKYSKKVPHLSQKN